MFSTDSNSAHTYAKTSGKEILDLNAEQSLMLFFIFQPRQNNIFSKKGCNIILFK